MADARIKRLADSWRPDPEDPDGEYKLRLLGFLLQSGATSAAPIPIRAALEKSGLAAEFGREAFQHRILGPLRRDPKVFIGTSSRGIFVVLTPEDADATLGFYTWRVRAELRHARNLRALAKRTQLFRNHTSKIPQGKERAVIYIDESGSPNVKDLDPPVFVVAAVIVGSNQDLSGLDQRFKNAFSAIRRPEEHEFKASALSVRKHAMVLRELSLLDYQWAAACFHKPQLKSSGFSDPKTLYKYAFQFLVSDLLTIAWQADLVIDESSTASFQDELSSYLRLQNSGMPVSRLQTVKFADSSKVRLVQLADLVAGAVRRSVEGDSVPLREIEHQAVNLHHWPPR